MSSLSTLDQSEQEIALLAIEGHVIWTLGTIESSITVDIKGANPGFDADTHVYTLKESLKINIRGGPGGLAPPVLVDMADRPKNESADII